MFMMNIFMYLQISCCLAHYENQNITSFYRRSEHPMAKAWLIDSVIGTIGILLNSTVMYMIIKEKESMIKCVNVMIGYDL